MHTRYSKVLIVGLGYGVSIFFLYHFWSDISSAFESLKKLSFQLGCWLLVLACINWGLESVRWHLSLKHKSLAQSFVSSTKQVLSAVPYALVFGKIVGSSAGRLVHFRGEKLLQGTKAQVLASYYQSLGLLFILLLSSVWAFKVASLAFAALLALCLAFLFVKPQLMGLMVLSLVRTIIIFTSYIVLLPNSDLVELVACLSKTFSVMTFVPFTPLANLGPKEWLMNYFYADIELNDYLIAGFTVFAFNNLLPAIVGILISFFNKWK